MKTLLWIAALTLATLVAQWALAAEPDEQAATELKTIQSMKPPAFDGSKRDDQRYIQSYFRQRQEWQEKRNDLIKGFFNRFPDRPDALKLMCDRWQTMAQSGQARTVIDETDPILQKTTDAAARADILCARAVARLSDRGSKEAAAAVDEFIKAAPKDPRGAAMLIMEASQVRDAQAKAALYHRVVDNYGDTPSAASAKGHLRQIDEIGKPFDLTFTDAVSGKEISVQKDLKGKVVVIDFWATWCGPCVGEMPNNKALYAKYHDKGVEFIGVSLDQPEAQGGLTALKQFVADKAIPWPQYYQGNGWQSPFSASWGIDSIPAMFAIDKDGKLSSVSARGELEEMIPKLLGKDEAAPR